MSLTYAQHGRAALHLAHAASLAPSPHNSQPWFFVEEGHDHGFGIHADRGRGLVLTDPGGRESVVACGAALFNARIAVRKLGFRPAVDLLPETGNLGVPGPGGFRRPRPGHLRRGADGGRDGTPAHAPRAVRRRARPGGAPRRPAGTRTG
ncbi:hypothetical protein ACRAWF_23650 [Streptomyces sp. L7]